MNLRKVTGQATMKKAVYTNDKRYAPHMVKIVQDFPVPNSVVPRGSVVVRVHAVGLNPADLLLKALGSIPIISKLKTFGAGLEFAGTVIGVNPKSAKDSEFKVGDNVMGFAFSSLCELLVVPENEVTHVPTSLDFVKAACLPVNAGTTAEAYDRGNIMKGDPNNENKSVLVVGGSGGCGGFGVQIAKAFGVGHVVSINSDKNNDTVKGFGADLCINYRNEEELREFILQNKGKFDCIYDTVSSRKEVDPKYYYQLCPLLDSSKRSNKYIQINGATIDFLKAMLARFLENMYSVFSKDGDFPLLNFHLSRNFEQFSCIVTKKRLKRVVELYEEGKLKEENVKATVFEFTQEKLKEAFDLVASRRVVGKVVIQL